MQTEQEVLKKCSTCGLPKDLCACGEIEKEQQRLETRKFGKPTTQYACEKASVCGGATKACFENPSRALGMPSDFHRQNMICTPSRRWMYCAQWKIRLGMVFSKEFGIWILPGWKNQLTANLLATKVPKANCVKNFDFKRGDKYSCVECSEAPTCPPTCPRLNELRTIFDKVLRQ